MRLEDYWGVGPKTSERLRAELGVERAVTAIENGEIRTLVDAGIPGGRATRILRRANGKAGMNVLGTRDVRDVYDELLGLAAEEALTTHASDRIRVLTPLVSREAVEDRLDDVLAARDAWAALDETARTAVIEAFERYDQSGATERAAVEAALALRSAGLEGDTFEALEGIDEDALREAAGALGYLEDGTVVEGADEQLDRLRERRDEATALENSAFDVLESVQESGVRNLEDFQHAFVEYVAAETSLDRGEVEAATVEDAVDTTDFVSGSLRQLVADLQRQVDKRESTVADRIRDTVENAREDVDAAVAAADDIAFLLSLGRFAVSHDLIRPTLVEEGVAVIGARNLSLGADVQPITYAVGSHGLDDEDAPAAKLPESASKAELPPSGQRVTVLTGANSGGKTTLLETLAQVSLLAAMGLPVPAERAELSLFDTIVFHRRHASFNAGVLESTLKSIVPPLAGEGRTLMLVDEFEAITEPGRAADLLNGLVELTVDRDALGVYVTHLADDLSPLPEQARIDGIFARGLTPELELEVDYQPQFGTIGKSTPEFIVSRLVANAGDRTERQGFEKLAEAVGEEAVQRTLSDARWRGAPDG